MVLGINFNHTQCDDIAFFEYLFGVLNALLADLRNVDQTFDIIIDAGESAEFRQAGDGAFELLTNLITRGFFNPGVLLQLAD